MSEDDHRRHLKLGLELNHGNLSWERGEMGLAEATLCIVMRWKESCQPSRHPCQVWLVPKKQAQKLRRVERTIHLRKKDDS